MLYRILFDKKESGLLFLYQRRRVFLEVDCTEMFGLDMKKVDLVCEMIDWEDS
jgi:hypothetical protein